MDCTNNLMWRCLMEKSIENELLELERQYWQAIKERDIETAMQLTYDPCLVAGSQGIKLVDRKQLGEMMKNMTYALNNFHLKGDAKVRLLSDDIAIVAYKVYEELTVDGKPLTMETAD